MSLEKNFCPSPWFHMRIANDGTMKYCRWADKSSLQSHISQTSPVEFFQQGLVPLRQALLEGEAPSGCSACYLMDQHGKISGRQKQLLKVGVRLDRFEKSLASSPWADVFADPDCKQLPQDWQIDLGNFCNSACVFCGPGSSSRLAAEWQRIGLIKELPPNSWSDDPVLLQRFIDTLKKSPHVQYIHFIGGETLITPAFKSILKTLIDSGLNQQAAIGFTTNLMAWDEDVIELLTKFNVVNLGMSIEAFDPINEYVRWPADMLKVQQNLERWLALSQQHRWLLQFRTTPTILSISRLLTVYKFAWQHNISIESCDFLSRPEFMRTSVLPMEFRKRIISDMQAWIAQHKVDHETIVNIRDPNVARQQVIQDLESYVNYLEHQPDESHRLPDLAQFLKLLETSRGNSILDYLPEYEELFKSAGY